MTDNKEYLEDMLSIFRNIYEDETKREASLHRSASCLITVSGILLGLSILAAAVMITRETEIMSLVDLIGYGIAVGTLFAGMLMSVLAQWHMEKDHIDNSDLILLQMQESPETFQTHDKRLQYEQERITKLNADLQKTNKTLNHRLRGAGIIILSGAGILSAVICLILFHI